MSELGYSIYKIGIYKLCKYFTYIFVIAGLFDTIGLGKSESVKFYNNWVNYVKKVVPPNRLLVFEAKQGWEPLCKFLDLPIPEGPFPRINDTPALLWNFKKLKIAAYVVVWGLPILIALLLAFVMFS